MIFKADIKSHTLFLAALLKNIQNKESEFLLLSSGTFTRAPSTNADKNHESQSRRRDLALPAICRKTSVQSSPPSDMARFQPSHLFAVVRVHPHEETQEEKKKRSLTLKRATYLEHQP